MNTKFTQAIELAKQKKYGTVETTPVITTPISQEKVMTDELAISLQDNNSLILSLDVIDVETQLREECDTDHVARLAEDIKDRGLRQAITVTETKNGRYRLETGEHRYLAVSLLRQRDSQNVKFHSIRATIVTHDQDIDRMLDQFQENVQRKDFSLLEEANAIKFFQNHYGIHGVREIALKLNISKNKVSRRLKLLDQPKEIQTAVATGQITQADVIKGNVEIIEEIIPASDQLSKESQVDSLVKKKITVKKKSNVPTVSIPLPVLETFVSLLVLLANEKELAAIILPKNPSKKQLITVIELRLKEIKDVMEDATN